MERSRGIVRRLSDRTDLQDECSAVLPLIEIAVNQRVLIEHHCGVIEYGRQRIVVRLKKGEVTVLGEGLELSLMTANQLVISGCIHSVDLEV